MNAAVVARILLGFIIVVYDATLAPAGLPSAESVQLLWTVVASRYGMRPAWRFASGRSSAMSTS